MRTVDIIDGRSILSSAITRIQNYSPRLSRATVTVVIPDPNDRGSAAALVSARQKQKAFKSVGFEFREVRVGQLSALVPRQQEFAIIQRPLDAQEVLSLFRGPVTDLESVAPLDALGEMSGTAEAALRI